jgi:hypothetical protein
MPRKKKPLVHFFRTIEDLHAIPLEKIEAFTIDLKLWLQQLRIVELTGKGVMKVTTPTDVFGWIDDGRHDVRVHLSAPPELADALRREAAQSDAAVDPSATDPGTPSTRARKALSDD